MKFPVSVSIATSIAQWQHTFAPQKFAEYILSAFGVLWLMTEVTSYFSPPANKWLKSSGWWIFLGLGVLFALYRMRPKTVYSYLLNGRDTVIEVRIADAFDVDGALVIPINTTFDTDLDGLIPRSPSVQSKFLKNYFDGNPRYLDTEIEAQLKKEGYSLEKLVADKPGKPLKYETGTVIQLRKQNRCFYLLAFTQISREGRAEASIDDLNIALGKLWYYISEKGDKGDIVIPLIGTLHARLPLKREEVFRNIVRSFIASCYSKNYCGKLTIVLYPPDVKRFSMDTVELARFVEHSCKYVEFSTKDDNPVGTPIT